MTQYTDTQKSYEYTGIHLVIQILLNLDVAKEIERQNTFWCEKGKEIENEFKKLYKPQPAPKLKKRGKKKQISNEGNKELSCYASALTKELLIKVSLQNRLFILFSFVFSIVLFVLPFHLIMRINSRSQSGSFYNNHSHDNG